LHEATVVAGFLIDDDAVSVCNLDVSVLIPLTPDMPVVPVFRNALPAAAAGLSRLITASDESAKQDRFGDIGDPS